MRGRKTKREDSVGRRWVIIMWRPREATYHRYRLLLQALLWKGGRHVALHHMNPVVNYTLHGLVYRCNPMIYNTHTHTHRHTEIHHIQTYIYTQISAYPHFTTRPCAAIPSTYTQELVPHTGQHSLNLDPTAKSGQNQQ